MKFEVKNKNGQGVMCTEDSTCIPTSDELEAMTAAGYRYKIDGKVVAKSNVSKTAGVSKPAVAVSGKVAIKSSEAIVHGVRCIENNTIYRNRVEAGKALGISDSSVGDSIRLKKKVKGYSFEIV